MINTYRLSYDYVKTDENDNITHVNRALNDISIDIKKGDFIAVLGHNGSGKSTFAKHLNALLLPGEGSVFVDGMDTAKPEYTWDIRKNTGMVFQNPDNQIVGNIVEEDVAFGLENLGLPSDEIRRRVDKSLEMVGMKEYVRSSPNKLSGGQKQRVAIAGIMAMEPACIVFDEPTAMLDPEGRREVIETAQKLNRENGITIILITHYMEEIVGADKVFVMEKGKIAMQGTPREIFSKPKELKALRLTVPQVTEIGYRIAEKHPEFPSPVLTVNELADAIKENAKLSR